MRNKQDAKQPSNSATKSDRRSKEQHRSAEAQENKLRVGPVGGVGDGSKEPAGARTRSALDPAADQTVMHPGQMVGGTPGENHFEEVPDHDYVEGADGEPEVVTYDPGDGAPHLGGGVKNRKDGKGNIRIK